MARLLYFCIASLLFFQACSSGQNPLLQPEPVLDQISADSEELCLKWKILGTGGYPCIKFRGTKENATGKVSYSLRYEVGTFDVELPVGMSLKLGDTWYNLTKLDTEYSSTIVYSSRLPLDILPIFKSASTMAISYTTRKKTENIVLSSGQKEALQSNLSKLIQALEAEAKLKIEKK